MKYDGITLVNQGMGRRAFLARTGALGLALAGGGVAGSAQRAQSQGLATVGEQLGWLANSQMAGDFVALDKGFFKEAGIDLKIQPGGPAIDPVQVVAGGGTMLGNAASISTMLIARSRGVPLKAFGTALQRHPFAFIFFTKSGIKTPRDFIGKTVGIQPTARPLLDAVLTKYQIPKDKVKVLAVGGDSTPLVTHQVDVITGWLINSAQMDAAQSAGNVGYFRLWDLGIRMYALTYFATDQALRDRKDVLARFLSGSARGWMYAAQHPEESIDILLRHTTGLDRMLELKTWQNEVPFLTSPATKQHGWGWMDAQVWKDLSEVYLSLNETPRPVQVDEVMTNEIVEMAKTPRV
jgi:NitT/TauT family transport system substrate-binding protein